MEGGRHTRPNGRKHLGLQSGHAQARFQQHTRGLPQHGRGQGHRGSHGRHVRGPAGDAQPAGRGAGSI
eukprot:4678203-Pyramimonas_sp.AAC.1